MTCQRSPDQADPVGGPQPVDRHNKEEPTMSEPDGKYTAQNLIRVHGLRAQAVVRERIAEARLGGDVSGLERWQNVQAAIGELRQTAPNHTAPGQTAPRVSARG
jgi:hypothetical protein